MMMNKLKQKHNLITLISKIYYLDIVEYITFKKYITDYLNYSKDLYVTDENLYHIESHLALFKLDICQHNDNCIMFKVQDPNKNIISMIETNNKKQLDRILLGAEAIVEGIQAYKNYILNQNKILEKQNNGAWLNLDLQQSLYVLTKEEKEFFKKIIKSMCAENEIDYQKLQNINFKFSFKAWKSFQDEEEDDDFDWI